MIPVVPHFAVYTLGADRPGIVAAVTGPLAELRCNLEDSSSTILRGQFAMMLIVATPEGVAARDIEQALSEPASEYGLVVSVRQVDERVPPPARGDAWNVSLYGADRSGIVHRVASLFAERGVNIVDLATRLIGDPARPTYVMVLEVIVPPEVDPDELAQALERLGDELSVECRLHPSDADIL